MPRFGHERADFLFDDLLGGRQCALAGFAIAFGGFFQIVDGVQVDAQLVGDFRLEIARHGQVENEERPLMAAGERCTPDSRAA